MSDARKLGLPHWMLPVMAALALTGTQAARADTPELAARDTQQAVAQALHLGGDAGSLQVLRAPLPANVRLHVVSVERAPGRTGSLARLACERSSDCLPFYVLVRGVELPPRPSAVEHRHASVRSLPPLARAGDRVEIVEQLSGLNLHTRGVCLQAGSLGERIRVRTLSNHRVLVATVAAPNLVKVER